MCAPKFETGPILRAYLNNLKINPIPISAQIKLIIAWFNILKIYLKTPPSKSILEVRNLASA